MCIIIAVTKESGRLTPDVIERAGLTNRDGFGVAWREGGKVHWAKGLGEHAVALAVEDMPLPYVMHARFATVGGNGAGLTHPFPIESYPSLALDGTTTGAVLFHNGHVGYWDALLEVLGTDTDTTGLWSDSRAVAHVLAGGTAKPGFLKWLAKDASSRFAVLSPSKLRLVGNWIESDGRYLSTTLPTRAAFCGWTTGKYGLTTEEEVPTAMTLAEFRTYQSDRAKFLADFKAGQERIAAIGKAPSVPEDMREDIRRMDADAGLDRPGVSDYRQAMDRGD